MHSQNIDQLIANDLEKLLYHKSLKSKVTVNIATEIAAYVAAKYLRIIFAKNKEIKPEELNGVFGIISNYYNEIFSNQLNTDDYKSISKTALNLLNDTNFDANCEKFFLNTIQ